MPVQPLPNYKTVPLRSDSIMVAVAQTTYRSIDANNAKQEIRKNLNHMLEFIDYIQMRRQRDLIVFHEFPLQGSDIRWTRDEQMAVAIEVPGEETELIGQKAKQYNCYIEFGSRALLKDWPGHFMDMELVKKINKLITKNKSSRDFSRNLRKRKENEFKKFINKINLD